jgi:hypothetical protein
MVDEYRLVINPVALGDGLPLFKACPSRSSCISSKRGNSQTGRRSTSTNQRHGLAPMQAYQRGEA